MPRTRFVIVFTLLIAGGAIATRGTPDPVVSLDSLNELWADTLRDTDQIGMKATRVSDAEEMKIGEELVSQAAAFGREDRAASHYVTAVGQIVAGHVSRRGIHYQFHVVKSAQINAFALPGGQIFVTSGMLDFLQSEAELAAILGHEISHVDLRNCIERYQYLSTLKKVGMPQAGQIVEFAHSLAAFSFAQYQEADADAQGERLAIESGYDPLAASAAFARIKVRMQEPARGAATTPTGEVTQSVSEALRAFIRSHPLSEDRIRNLDAQVGRQRSELAGRSFYVGRQNLLDRVPRSTREYPNEYRTLP